MLSLPQLSVCSGSDTASAVLRRVCGECVELAA